MNNDNISVRRKCICAETEDATTLMTQPDEVYCTVDGVRTNMTWKASASSIPYNSASPIKTNTSSDQEPPIEPSLPTTSPTPTVTSSKETNGLPTVTPNHSGPITNEGKSRNHYMFINCIIIVVLLLICYLTLQNDRCYGWLSSINVRKHIPPLYWLIKTDRGLGQHNASSCAMDDTPQVVVNKGSGSAMNENPEVLNQQYTLISVERQIHGSYPTINQRLSM
ncbi:uncharacterized protein [Hyperolius riggenbachi]